MILMLTARVLQGTTMGATVGCIRSGVAAQAGERRYVQEVVPMMVGRYDESRLLLVSQVDHSRVAGLLAAHWGNDTFAPPTPYLSMVLAAQEHDTGWWEWENKPTLNEAGYPPDYIGSIRHLGRGVWLDFYRRGIQRVAAQDPYAGYMVSMHGDGLLTQGMGLLPYMPDYTDDAAVVAFLDEQKALRADLRPRLQADGI